MNLKLLLCRRQMQCPQMLGMLLDLLLLHVAAFTPSVKTLRSITVSNGRAALLLSG